MTRRRPLAVALALGLGLVLVLGLVFVLPRLAPAPAPAPTFEDLHAAAAATPSLAAFERARASLFDPRASAVYALGIDHLRAGRRDLADAAFASALASERESWVDR